LLFSVIFFLKEIPEKEDFEDDEYNKQFDQDYDPDTFTPPGHVSETIIIKTEQPV
jgi:hypothetical protein